MKSRAHAVGITLAKKQAEVSRLKTENKRNRKCHTQDRKNAGGGCIDSFGHHGLQLYSAPSATEIKVVRRSCRTPAALMVAISAPDPTPKDGKTATLLERRRVWRLCCQTGKSNQAWRDWAGNHSRKVGNLWQKDRVEWLRVTDHIPLLQGSGGVLQQSTACWRIFACWCSARLNDDFMSWLLSESASDVPPLRLYSSKYTRFLPPWMSAFSYRFNGKSWSLSIWADNPGKPGAKFQAARKMQHYDNEL